MNRNPLLVAVRRALLGLSLAAAGSAIPPALAQETAPQQEPAAAPADPGPAVLEDVEVIGRQRSAVGDILQERIEAETVADLVSAEQIGRVGDSTVSLALRRLPGVTLVNDKFIYIRGLGERYSSTTVNGAYVPSPDLTRSVIPMDLFPAEIVQSISIQKGYSADQPAAFGGGNVDIRTRGLPEEFVFNIQAGTGANSNSDDDGITYPGGKDDNFGEDDGTRALPSEIEDAIQLYRGNISANSIFNHLQLDGEIHEFEEAQAINRQLIATLHRDIDFRETSMDPDMSAELSVGNSIYAGGADQVKIGFLALADYKNQWRNRERIIRSASTPDLDFDIDDRTTNQVTATGSLGFGIDVAEEHRIEANGIYLRNTEDEASLTLGHNFNFRQESGARLRNYRIRFEERELELVQVRGSHELGDATRDLFDGAPRLLELTDGLQVDWYYSDAKATTDIPSEILVSASDVIDPDTGDLIRTGVRSSLSAAEYRFTDLEDSVTSYGGRFALPRTLGKALVEISGGYDYYEKGRSYIQTQLNFGTQAGAAAAGLVGTPGDVLTDENLLNPDNQYSMTIGGIGTESYLAGETVDAMWGKMDLNYNDLWRFTAGLRWEDFERLAVPIDPLEFDLDPGIIGMTPEELENAVVTDDEYYPSAALTIMRPGFWAEDFQLRLGWSKTVARPDLREISDATYIDPFTDARVQGNPSLVNSDLTNFDLRAEWFFDGGDNFTASLFYKDIKNPIETVEGAGSDDNVTLSFVNAESAEVYGLELEGLKSLGFLSNGGWSSAFFVSGNVTVSDSEITIGDAAPNLTNDKRPMTQHADLVVNVTLGYDSPGGMHGAALAYNMSSERIFFAGRFGADDAKEQPINSLDLTYSIYPTEKLSFKIRLQNLLDEDFVIEQNGVDVLEQNLGTTAKLDISYRF
ncbi:MAG: TonB-dependent receptor domain-containing protein [Steroidobacteraceae bacterium]